MVATYMPSIRERCPPSIIFIVYEIHRPWRLNLVQHVDTNMFRHLDNGHERSTIQRSVSLDDIGTDFVPVFLWLDLKRQRQAFRKEVCVYCRQVYSFEDIPVLTAYCGQEVGRLCALNWASLSFFNITCMWCRKNPVFYRDFDNPQLLFDNHADGLFKYKPQRKIRPRT